MTDEWKVRAKVTGTTTVQKDRTLVLDSMNERRADYSGRKLDSFCPIASRFEKCRFERMVSCPPVRRAGLSSEQAVFRRTKPSNDADFCLVVRLLPVFSLSPLSTYD